MDDGWTATNGRFCSSSAALTLTALSPTQINAFTTRADYSIAALIGGSDKRYNSLLHPSYQHMYIRIAGTAFFHSDWIELNFPLSRQYYK